MNSGTLPFWFVFSAPFLCQALFQTLGGRLADRLGPRRALMLGMIWCSVCVTCAFLTLAMRTSIALADSEQAVLLSLIVLALGLGETLVYPALSGIIAKSVPLAGRGIASGFIFGGIFLSPVIKQQLYREFGILTLPLFAPAAILGAIAAFVCYRMLRDGTLPPGPQPIRRIAPWETILGSKDVWAIAASYTAFGFAAYNLVGWFVNRPFEFRSPALPFVAMAICSPVGGFINDQLTLRYGKRMGRRGTAISGMVLAAVFFALAGLGDPSFLWILVSAAAGALGLSLSSFWSVTADLGGSSAVGSVSGVMLTGALTGGAAAAMLSRTTFPLTMLIAAVLCVAGSLLWLLTDPEHQLT